MRRSVLGLEVLNRIVQGAEKSTVWVSSDHRAGHIKLRINDGTDLYLMLTMTPEFAEVLADTLRAEAQEIRQPL